jgi:hypothetical protein
MTYFIHQTTNLNIPYGMDITANDNNIANVLNNMINDIETISIRIKENSENGDIIFSTSEYESIDGELLNEMTYDKFNLLSKVA